MKKYIALFLLNMPLIISSASKEEPVGSRLKNAVKNERKAQVRRTLNSRNRTWNEARAGAYGNVIDDLKKLPVDKAIEKFKEKMEDAETQSKKAEGDKKEIDAEITASQKATDELLESIR